MRRILGTIGVTLAIVVAIPTAAVGIPILSEAGVPQISPANTYVGLTTDDPGPEPAAPDKFCPSSDSRGPSYSIDENGDTTLTDHYEPGTVSPFVQGGPDHDGSGPSLAAGGKTVELTDFVIDPGAAVLTSTVSVHGDVAAEDAPLFFLDGRTLNPLQAGDTGTAVLEGTTVKLKAEAADPLSQTIGIDDLQEGLQIGLAEITINTSA